MIQNDDPDFLPQQFSGESEPDHGDKIDDPTKTIVLYPARKKALDSWKKRIPLLVALVILLIACLTHLIGMTLQISSILRHSGLSSVAWILTTGCFLFVPLYLVILPISVIRGRNAVRRDTMPAFVISEDGLKIHLGPMVGNLDTIPWSNIGEVYVKRSFGEQYLGINVKDIMHYAPTLRSKMFFLYVSPSRFLMRTPTICIPDHFLHLDVADVAILINERKDIRNLEITKNARPH